jgi:phosphoribosylglycinamide formyltransferase 1
MRKSIFDPHKSGKRMNIVCFISGSGTNYREIVARNPEHNYLVFTNRPDCTGVDIAKNNGHTVLVLNQIPFLKEAKQKYGKASVPRNCPERELFEKEACHLIEQELGKKPDLVCLAGYDQWLTDWTVERYYSRILNVHPGDTTKGYEGLHWIPAAKAILSGDKTLRSTLFVVDKGEDTGPVLLQSAPLKIVDTLEDLEKNGQKDLLFKLNKVIVFAAEYNIKTYPDFCVKADPDIKNNLELISRLLQDVLKIEGDWKIYPFAVHDLIAAGRVEIDNRQLYIDGNILPPYGFRLEELNQ